VSDEQVAEIGDLLRDRNAIDAKIAAVTQRPMTAGHLGEWLAAQIFDVELETSAVATAIDGRFRSGPLRGRTVNVKWYLKQEGLLDTTDHEALDFYLVLTGPVAPAASSKGGTRPWCIERVYLFDARRLRDEQTARGIKSSVAASVRKAQWSAAEIYPSPTNGVLALSERQRQLLGLFSGTRVIPHAGAPNA
jgi:hypothetical protein